MAKYLGPYDTFQLEEGGKEYHPGDNVPITAAQRAQYGRKYQFEDDPAQKVEPSMHVNGVPEALQHAPDEHGVPVGPSKTPGSARSHAESASTAASAND